MQILENIIEQALQVVVRFDDDRFVHIAFLHLGIVLLRLVEQANQFFLVRGLNVLAHQLQGIAIGDGLVVIVLVDIVAKHSPRGTFLTQQRSARQGNLDGIAVGIEQIGKERTLRIISAMGFIDKEHPLQVDVIGGRQVHFFVVLLKLLDVDHHDFGST